MSVRAADPQARSDPKVIQLHPADHIPTMLRQLADRIDAGEIDAQEMLCIARTGINAMSSWAWGEYRGSIAALGMLEAAKTQFPVRDNTV